MTADEIRNIPLESIDSGRSGNEMDHRALILFREIAAQLAELNERLKPLEIRDRTFEYPEGRR